MKTPTRVYSDVFFSGRNEVRRRLVDAIRGAREDRKLDPDDLDHLCGFGTSGDSLPRCKDFEANPDLLTSGVFSLASFPLSLELDQVLAITLKREQLDEIAREMEAASAGAVSAMPGVNNGGETAFDVPLQQQAHVYVLLKIMQEIEQ